MAVSFELADKVAKTAHVARTSSIFDHLEPSSNFTGTARLPEVVDPTLSALLHQEAVSVTRD